MSAPYLAYLAKQGLTFLVTLMTVHKACVREEFNFFYLLNLLNSFDLSVNYEPSATH